jgi:steroid Delta-isomerase
MTAAGEHVEAFNAAVRSGDFAEFVRRFHPDAVMTFVGPPAGPFTGRAEIAAAYAEQPPDDTMEIRSVSLDGDTEVTAFQWSRGDTGTMRIRRRDGLITDLTVIFD